MLRLNPDILDKSLRIDQIEWASLTYQRPRVAGRNARLDVHGLGGDVPVARVTIGGVSGFGWSRLTRQQGERLVGTSLRALFDEDHSLREEYHALEFPLLDWIGQMQKQPVYKLVTRNTDAVQGQYTVPVYDTTIYFDEPDGVNDRQAIELLLGEVDFGLAGGHKHFKVKIGRCGRWMEHSAGLRRDISLIQAIRERIGPEGRLMVDANNGYNLNITKTFLKETADANLHWLEEAFHEDDQLYTDLKFWMKQQGIAPLIADGEGYACPSIEDWAKKGLVDVLQYDLRDYGFFRWMKLGEEMDRHGVLSAPHNYGGFYGNYAQTHFAASIASFAFAEWDQSEAEAIDTSAYSIRDGRVLVPELPGFGLKLDAERFRSISGGNGWQIKL